MLRNLLLFVTIIASVALAQVHREITYQGLLLGNDEQPLPEGQYKLTFRLYDEPGNELWSEVHNQVFIAGGLFQK